MDAVAFATRRAELMDRLRHAVPRSARAKALAEQLREMVRAELERELADHGDATRIASAPSIPEPPADLFARTGEAELRNAAALYGGRRPWWTED